MHKLPKLLILWLVGLSLVAMPLQAASSPQSTISTISSLSSSSVHLEFNSPSVSVKPSLPRPVKEQIHPDGTFTTFETSLPLIGQPSEPALPIMTQLVGVPSDQIPQVMIDLANAQPIATSSDPIQPMPTYERQQTEGWRQALNQGADTLDSETLDAEFSTNEELYARDEWFPANPVEIGEPMTLRGQMVIEVRFNPVQVNLVTGQIRWFSSADVTLDWSNEQMSSNLSFVEDSHYESFFASILSNYEQAKAWRVSSTQAAQAAQASQAARSSHTAGSNSWMITIDRQGLFGIPFSQLQAAGVDTGNPDRLALYYGSGETQQEQALWIDSETLYFVNTREHNRWSKDLVYRLELLSSGTGKRMSTLSSPPTQATTIDSVPYELRFEENTVYESLGAVAGATDRWYWKKFLVLPTVLPSNSFSHFFALPGLVNTHTADPVTITTEFAPLESGCHHARILINDVEYAEKGNGCEWSDLTAFDEPINVPHIQMLESNHNKFAIQQELQQGTDTLMLNSFTVRYQRSLTTQQDGLTFDSDRTSGVNFNVTGITQLFLPVVIGGPSQTARVSQSSEDVAVSQVAAQNDSTFTSAGSAATLAFEISTTGEPQRITDGTQNGLGFIFGRATPANERYLLIERNKIASVNAITPYTNSDLRNSSHQADYLIITHPDFASALQPLVAHRQAACGPNREACTVKLVTTTQIYNEFGAGVMDPQAIRDFTQYAYQNWSRPAPAYLLLVGDATYDPFDYTGGGKKVWLPPWMVDVDLFLGEVPGDHGYVVGLDSNDGNHDLLSDMHSGRLPVSTAEQTSAIVQKIINYETNAATGDWRRSILLTTDDTPDTAGDFYALSDHSTRHFTDNMIVTKAYLGQSGYENNTDVRNKIVEKMNEGIVISQYIGHSARTQWAGEAVWATVRSDGTNDLDLLASNDRLPVNLPWTCLEGYFILPNQESIAEEMLRMSDRGIIASFSPTGLDVATGHDVLTQGFYEGLFEKRETQLGPLTSYAKTDLIGRGYERMLYTYIYLGDPALYMNIDLP